MKTVVPDPSQNLLNEGARLIWARETLAIPVEASTDVVRAEVLDRLQDCDFMPPAPLRQAIWFLNDATQSRGVVASDTVDGKGVTVGLAADSVNPFVADVEARLSDEIEEFACTFFDRLFNERRQRWVELTSKARPFARLRLRLAPLVPGLTIERPVPVDDPKTELLARRVTTLFVLPPGQQESVRQQWLREMKASGSWKSAVRKFRARYSKLAQLEPDLLAALEIQESTGPRITAARTVIPGIVVKSKQALTPTPVRKGQSGNSRAPYWIMVAIIMSAVRGLTYLGDHSTPPPYRYTSPIAPSLPYRPLNSVTERTREENAIREMLRDRSSIGQTLEPAPQPIGDEATLRAIAEAAKTKPPTTTVPKLASPPSALAPTLNDGMIRAIRDATKQNPSSGPTTNSSDAPKPNTPIQSTQLPRNALP